MQKNYAGLRFGCIILFVFAAIGVRAFSVIKNLDGAADYIFYALLLCGISIIAYECFKVKGYGKAFGFDNNFHLDVFSFAAALGFFIDFIVQCYRIYQSVDSGAYHLFAYFAPRCLICVSALISSFYFCTAALSFRSSRYDFRRLKVIHLVPVIWAGARILALIEQADTLKNNPNGVLKYAVLTFALCFFYCFASEVERDGGARNVTVFFSRAFSLLGELFFLDMLMLNLAGKTELSSFDSLLSLSLLLIGSFAFFFEKNIISKSTEIN